MNLSKLPLAEKHTEIKRLCPLLAKMEANKRHLDYSEAILRMSKAYILNDGEDTGNRVDNALLYLSSLKERKFQ